MKARVGAFLTMLAAVLATLSIVFTSIGFVCQMPQHLSFELSNEPPQSMGGSLAQWKNKPSTSDSLDDEGLKPLDCSSFLEDVYEHRMYFNDTNKGQMFVRRTILNPPFYISLHNKETDHVRWLIFDAGKYYEKALARAFQEVLGKEQATPSARVLDVGGNIGWFSLLSASMGFHVDTFEPNLINVVRLCESIYLNRWESSVSEKTLKMQTDHRSSINIYANGVGDVDNKTLPLAVSYLDNPGAGSFVGSQSIRRSASARGERMVTVITLDRMAEDKGWFDSRPVIAILKVDVEGFEPKVFRGAQRLLKSHLVKNIFMEATVRNNRTEALEMFSLVIQSGYQIYKIGKWSGPSKNYTGPTDKASIPKYLLEDCRQMKRSQCNLWFKLPDSDYSI